MRNYRSGEAVRPELYPQARVAVQWYSVKGMKSLKGTSEVAKAIFPGRTTEIEKLHFSPFKNPFNLIALNMVHVSR